MVIFEFPDKVVKIKCLDRYLFKVVSGNRYLPRGKENILSITITMNVTMSSLVAFTGYITAS